MFPAISPFGFNNPLSPDFIPDLVDYAFRNSCEADCEHVLAMTAEQKIDLAARRSQSRGDVPPPPARSYVFKGMGSGSPYDDGFGAWVR